MCNIEHNLCWNIINLNDFLLLSFSLVVLYFYFYKSIFFNFPFILLIHYFFFLIIFIDDFVNLLWFFKFIIIVNNFYQRKKTVLILFFLLIFEIITFFLHSQFFMKHKNFIIYNGLFLQLFFLSRLMIFNIILKVSNTYLFLTALLHF